MKKHHLLSAAVLLLLSGFVSAATIEMNYSSSNGMQLDFNLGTKSFTNQWAGQFSPVHLDFDSDYTTWTPDLTTISYCVDLNGTTTAIHDQYIVDLESATSAGSNYLNAAWLMNQYATAADTAAKKAGLQVAIWEVIYDTTHSLTAGNFNVVGSSTAYTYANSYLAALAGATSFTGLEHYMVAYSKDYQDQLIHTPIPMAVWLFGSGLLGLVSFRRGSGKA